MIRYHCETDELKEICVLSKISLIFARCCRYQCCDIHFRMVGGSLRISGRAYPGVSRTMLCGSNLLRTAKDLHRLYHYLKWVALTIKYTTLASPFLLSNGPISSKLFFPLTSIVNSSNRRTTKFGTPFDANESTRHALVLPLTVSLKFHIIHHV